MDDKDCFKFAESASKLIGKEITCSKPTKLLYRMIKHLLIVITILSLFYGFLSGMFLNGIFMWFILFFVLGDVLEKGIHLLAKENEEDVIIADLISLENRFVIIMAVVFLVFAYAAWAMKHP